MKYIAFWLISTFVFAWVDQFIPGYWGTIIAGCLMAYASGWWKIRDDMIGRVVETIRSVCRNGDFRNCIMPLEDGVGDTLLTLLPRDDSGKIIGEVLCPVVKSRAMAFSGELNINVLPRNGMPGTTVIVSYGPSENEHGCHSRIKAVRTA